MIFVKVKSIIVDQLDVDEDKVTLNSNIQDDLGADSLDIVDLVMSFEDEFDLEIQVGDLVPDNFNSTEGMIALIEKLQDED